MATGKHGSPEWTISIDDSTGGTLRAITPYVTSIGGIKLTSVMQVITAFGDAFQKNLPVGMTKFDPVPIHGFFDDTASVGPHVVFIAVDVVPTAASARTLTCVVGNSKQFTIEVWLESYQVLGKNEALTEYEAVVVQATTAGTWS